MEVSTECVFRANNGPAKALAIAYYDDDLNLTKVSGGPVKYDTGISGYVFYSDAKKCTMTVPLKKKGATAKASYSLTYTKPEFFTRMMMLDSYDMEHYTIRIEMPVSLASRYEICERNLPEGMMTKKREENGDKVTLFYEFQNLKGAKMYSDAPSPRIYAPQLYVKGHFKDVEELYRYIYSYIPESDPGEADVIAKAKEITAGCATDRERIEAINDFVHDNIRYVAIEHGDNSHRPDLPSEVLRKRYGDCKCSAALIRAMLRGVGIDGRYVWIGTSKEIGVDWTEDPNISSGNHMIAAAMLPDTIIYMDGTASHHALGIIPTGDQGRQVLIEDTKERCIVERVPVEAIENSSRLTDLDVTFGDNRLLKVKGNVTLTGNTHAWFSQLISNTLPGQREEEYHTTFSQVLKGCRTTSVVTESDKRNTIIAGEGDAAGVITESGSETYVELNAMPNLAALKFDTEERKVPGWVDRAHYITTINLHLPEDMKSGELPRDVQVANDWFSGHVTNRLSDDGRTIKRTLALSITGNEVAVEQMATFNTDVQKLIRACNTKLLLMNREAN